MEYAGRVARDLYDSIEWISNARSVLMPSMLDRRRFLQRSAVLGGSLLIGGIPLNRAATTVPVRIDAPVIDELTVREITDNSHDIFLRGAELPGLVVRRTGFR